MLEHKGRAERLLRPSSPVWAIGSQGFNSVSNVLLAIAVAGCTSPTEFGAWSVVYALFILVYSALRSAVGTPILVARDEEEPRKLADGMLAIGMLTGLAAGILTLALLLLPGVAPYALPFAAAITLVGAIDAVRSTAFRVGRHLVAAVMDGLWLAVQVALMFLITPTGTDGAAMLTYGWGLGGGVALALGTLLLGLRPTPRAATAAWPVARTQGAGFMGDQLIIGARTHVTPLLLAVLVGYAATGALRAGLTLLGFFNASIAALVPLATLRAARRAASEAPMRAFYWGWTALVAALGLGNGLALLLVPDRWGLALLGENWAPARTVLLPLMLFTLTQGAATAAPIIFKARREMGALLRFRSWSEPLSLACPIMGVLVGGAVGAAWGFALASAVTGLVAALVTLRGHRRLPAPT